MDTDTKRRIVRAARELLQWDQGKFAAALKVGTATLKRFEAGYAASEQSVDLMLSGLAPIGVIVIERSSIGGLEVLAGVALLTSAEIGDPRQTRVDAKPGVRKAARNRVAPPAAEKPRRGRTSRA